MKEFLKTLLATFDQSVIDYKAYLAAGKTYRYAQVLKANNGKALQLLIDHKDNLPGFLLQDADALIEHYVVWTRKWEDLAARLRPGPDETFVFPNTVTFPRESASRLQAFYEELTGS